ncbi:MAG: hypothetical protein RLZZ09_214 [Pseudomonadota bacterium]|jgi:hypothetical protein
MQKCAGILPKRRDIVHEMPAFQQKLLSGSVRKQERIHFFQ